MHYRPTGQVDQPSVIIGGGKLGRALAEWGGTGLDVIVGRGEAIPEEIEMPGAWGDVEVVGG